MKRKRNEKKKKNFELVLLLFRPKFRLFCSLLWKLWHYVKKKERKKGEIEGEEGKKLKVQIDWFIHDLDDFQSLLKESFADRMDIRQAFLNVFKSRLDEEIKSFFLFWELVWFGKIALY